MDQMFYTGIGSRATPSTVKLQMMEIAKTLAYNGYSLRSGGADGADSAFEMGASQISKVPGVYEEIYLPWAHFNGNNSELILNNMDNADKAKAIAATFHPVWDRLSPVARKFHARNSYQVLGANLKTPSLFIICWTPNAKGGGGTGQALRLAKAYDIPIMDLASSKAEAFLEYFADRSSNNGKTVNSDALFNLF